jgi:antirestriction protein ArdC
MKTIAYETITNSIIAALENGTVPWVRPWNNKFKGIRYQPHNMTSGKDYNGINVLSLACAQMDKGYCSGSWATYKQISELGGNVRKGEKSSMVVYYQMLDKTVKNADGTEEDKRIPLLKMFNVFNLEQTEGLNAEEIAELTWHDIPESEDTLHKSGAIIRHGGNKAFYRPSDDSITLPEKGTFPDAGSYYATAFHELTHWTGHEHRTPRVKGKKFGDDAYAFEELVAEIGAAFLCARHEIQGELQHASYIDSWLRVLKSDHKAIFTASAYAQKATDFIMALASQPVQIAA